MGRSYIVGAANTPIAHVMRFTRGFIEKVLGERAACNARVETAYHEAGHAVIGIELGLRVMWVTIEPTGEYLGACQFKARRTYEQMMRLSAAKRRQVIENDVIVDLAGDVAADLFLAAWDALGPSEDRESAVDRVTRLSSSEAESRAYLQWLLERARRLVWESQDTIAIVADRLVERGRLQGPEVHKIVAGFGPARLAGTAA